MSRCVPPARTKDALNVSYGRAGDAVSHRHGPRRKRGRDREPEGRAATPGLAQPRTQLADRKCPSRGLCERFRGVGAKRTAAQIPMVASRQLN